MTTIVPQLVRNSFGVTYVREPRIRRQANHFEDVLQGSYGQPQVFPVPDELDPRMPRMVFSSTHGFSQISISQVNASLNVTYSPDWQTDTAQCRAYLHERINLIFDALQKTSDPITVLYAGLVTVMHLPSDIADEDLVGSLANHLIKPSQTELFDIAVKQVYVIEETYFHNVTVENYRTWKQRPSDERFPMHAAEARGISITGDFNDRYALNERESYFTNRKTSSDIIDAGLDAIGEIVEKIREIFQ